MEHVYSQTSVVKILRQNDVLDYQVALGTLQ